MPICPRIIESERLIFKDKPTFFRVNTSTKVVIFFYCASILVYNLLSDSLDITSEDNTAEVPPIDRVPLYAQKSDCQQTVACAISWQTIELAAADLERRQKPRAYRREVVAIEDCRD